MFLLETFFLGSLIESFVETPAMKLCEGDLEDILEEIRKNQGYHFLMTCSDECRHSFYHLKLHGFFLGESVKIGIYVAVDRLDPKAVFLLGSVIDSNLQVVGYRRDPISDEEAMFIFSLAFNVSNYWKKLRGEITFYHQSHFSE